MRFEGVTILEVLHESGRILLQLLRPYVAIDGGINVRGCESAW